MNRGLEWLSGPLWSSLIAALLHTLWQGALLAALVWATLKLVPARRTTWRYAVPLAALGAIVLSGLVTCAILALPREPMAASTEAVHAPVSEAQPEPQAATFAVEKPGVPPAHEPSPRRDWLPYLAALWLLGVTVMLARIASQFASAHRLARNRGEAPPPHLLATLQRLRETLRVRPRVRIAVLEHARGPAVWGVLRPIILLPAALLSAAPPDLLAAMLAHELAHVRRHDALVNLLQLLIEAALFFNPAVWWISRQVRLEREACCDALAVAATGDPLAYARALKLCAELASPDQAGSPALAMAAPPRPLLDRVKRLIVPGHRPDLRVS